MEAGRKVVELAREVGVSEATLYTWKSKYGGMEVSEARRPAVELERFSSRYKVGTGLQACPLQGRQECLPYLAAVATANARFPVGSSVVFHEPTVMRATEVSDLPESIES